MADIKTKDTVKGTIKTLDRGLVASQKFKNAYSRTKERAESAYSSDEGSPSEYAEDRITSAGKLAAGKAGHKANEIGRKNAEAVRNKLIKTGSEVKSSEEVRIRHDISRAKVPQNTAGRQVSVNRDKAYAKGVQSLKKKKMVRMTQQKLLQNRKNAKDAKKTASMLIRMAKQATMATKTLISAVIAGGWIAVIVIIICCLFGAAFYFFGDESSQSYTPVSEEVEAYTPIIQKYANEYGIGEYTDLIKAVMMQESGEKGTDPMQASECGFNKKYPNKPNAIKVPDYSIKCGVQMLASVLKSAKCSSPVDMDHIKLALQGYNFGSGYISWAFDKYGGYSKDNAIEYSKLQAKKTGASSYGDTEYVEHVLRYYPYGNYSYDVVFTGPGRLGLPIKGMTKNNISSHFGSRSSPGGIGSSNHQGLDIAFPSGTKVLACESGTVTTAGWNGGLGMCIIIDHGKGIKTVYGHLSKINVKKGQKVVRGQYIGNVGSTGDSTGPHLHLGVMLKGSFVNPEKGWLDIP